MHGDENRINITIRVALNAKNLKKLVVDVVDCSQNLSANFKFNIIFSASMENR